MSYNSDVIIYNNEKLCIGIVQNEELNTAIVLVGDANFSIFALVGALNCPGPSPRVPNDLRKCPSRVKSEIRWLPHSLT